jgi:ankyrin repeat protein
VKRRRLELGAVVLLALALVGVAGGAGYWYVNHQLLNRRMVRLLDAYYALRVDPRRQQAIVADIRLAVREGADPWTHDNDSVTALIIAAKSGDPTFVREALRGNAPVNARTASGDTPLLCAIRSGNRESVDLILAAGADVNTETESNTPLLAAISRGDSRLVERLLAAGADVSARTRSGATPLATAKARKGAERKELVRLLEHAGARGGTPG